MKKRCAALAVLAVVTGLMVAGCGKTADNAGGWKADENSIYVTKDMGVESAMVYTAENFNDLYTQEGLEAFAKEAVDAFNGGQEAVTLKSCSLEGKTGTLVFDYTAPEELPKFYAAYGDESNTVKELSVKKLADSVQADGFAEAVFVTAAGKTAEAADVLKQGDGGMIVVDGAATVYTEGKMTFATEGCTFKSDYCVVTPEGRSFLIFK